MFSRIPDFLLLLPLGYLFGSLPSAWIIVRLFYGRNIYEMGSRNGGTTNVYRLYGRLPALAVLIMDMAKGFFPSLFLVPATMDKPFTLLITAGAILGHAFPLWTRFRGGKGVAVGAGSLAALFPLSVPFCLGAFLLGALGSGYASVGSLAAGVTLPLSYLLYHHLSPRGDFLLTEAFLTFISLGIIFLHRSNIKRLIRGEEKSWRRPKPDREASSQGDGD
ncbi:MAG: glycerol-3-phosphate 1-O-acyltransferase PlsY [Spirochaetales bacterium]|nr:glycerol-3-phosphate 1-O-acyltransferase PlsY [Spirochaetales bacterium]